MTSTIDDQIIAGEEDTEQIVEQIERRKPYQAYLDAELGLRNHWYAALFGNELDEGECRGEMLLGERILFKRAAGKVYALADRCPDRGAAFSARPECYSTNTITCWFHGFTFDVRDGRLVQIVTEPDSVHIGRLRHKTYPVEERNGVVFVFVGELDPPPALDADLMPKFNTPQLVVHPVARNKVRGNWRLAVESGFDAAHIYGHRNAGLCQVSEEIKVPLSTYPSTKSAVTMQDADTGPWGIVKCDDINVRTVDIEDVKITAATVDPDNLPPVSIVNVGSFLPCSLEVEPFPVPGVIHFEWYTPIDEDHHSYMIAFGKVVDTPAQEAEFHAMCETVGGPMVWQGPAGQTAPVGDGPEWGFNNFDAFGREQLHHAYQYEDFWHKEHLFAPDYIIVRWRMLVAKRMRGIQQRRGWATTHGWSPDGRNFDPGKHE